MPRSQSPRVRPDGGAAPAPRGDVRLMQLYRPIGLAELRSIATGIPRIPAAPAASTNLLSRPLEGVRGDHRPRLEHSRRSIGLRGIRHQIRRGRLIREALPGSGRRSCSPPGALGSCGGTGRVQRAHSWSHHSRLCLHGTGVRGHSRPTDDVANGSQMTSAPASATSSYTARSTSRQRHLPHRQWLRP